MNSLKKLINLMSFHFMDVCGIIIGLSVISNAKNMQDIFYFFSDPLFYVLLLIGVFLYQALIWILLKHGEGFYLKQTLINIVGDFIRVTIVTLCVIGIYLLSELFIK